MVLLESSLLSQPDYDKIKGNDSSIEQIPLPKLNKDSFKSKSNKQLGISK